MIFIFPPRHVHPTGLLKITAFLQDEAAESYLPVLAELDKLALSAPASQALLRKIHEEFQ